MATPKSWRVSLVWRIALTFLRKKGSKKPTFTAVFSALGVALGVCAFLVVVTIFQSFEHELKRLLVSANPHLVIYSFPAGISQPQNLMKRLRQELPQAPRAMSVFEYAEAMVAKSGATAAVVVRGIPGTRAASAAELQRVIFPEGALATLNVANKEVSENKNDYFPVIIGKSLSKKINAVVGDEVILSSSGFGLVGNAVVQKLKVTGILEIGLAQYDERLLLLSFAHAQKIFGRKGFSKGIEVQFDHVNDALKASQFLQKTDLPYTIRAVQELDSGLFQQVERDGAAIKIVVLIITLVAGFNIVATLYLGVVDRSKAIGILRSLGASRKLIMSVFICIGTFLGSVGGLVGVLLGITILKIFAGRELGELQSFYFVPRIPVQWDYRLFAMALAVAWVLSFLSALYPAWRATQVSPLHAIKR